MNCLVKEDYDRFKQTRTIIGKKLIEAEIIDSSIFFHGLSFTFGHESTPDHSSNVLGIAVGRKEGLGSKCELQLIIDNSKRFFIPLSLTTSNNCGELISDVYVCKLTDSNLKTICEASTIEMRISNGNDYLEASTNELKLTARILYNTVVDETAYKQEIEAYAQKLENEEKARAQELENEKRAHEQELESEKRNTINKLEEQKQSFQNKKVGWSILLAILVTPILVMLYYCIKISLSIAEEEGGDVGMFILGLIITGIVAAIPAIFLGLGINRVLEEMKYLNYKIELVDEELQKYPTQEE